MLAAKRTMPQGRTRASVSSSAGVASVPSIRSIRLWPIRPSRSVAISAPEGADEGRRAGCLLRLRQGVEVVDQRAGDDHAVGQLAGPADVLRAGNAEADRQWQVGLRP